MKSVDMTSALQPVDGLIGRLLSRSPGKTSADASIENAKIRSPQSQISNICNKNDTSFNMSAPGTNTATKEPRSNSEGGTPGRVSCSSEEVVMSFSLTARHSSARNLDKYLLDLYRSSTM